ncbi:MAG: methionyl-tRNA formyltransferase [Candidatus Methylacidiphilales bacterium]|nr:methionyl-tRNA formyltransferase [Candidatus Methylacidiphilales bacterium]
MNIVFVGTGELGVKSLEAIASSTAHTVSAVITQPDRPAGRGMKLKSSAIKEFCFKKHLRVYQPEKINQQSSIEQIKYLNPDVLVVAAYGQILSRRVLNTAVHGCLNIHASLLPRHRGAAPIQAAIREADRETGVTIMWMDEGLDTGDILLQESTLIRMKDNAQVLHDRLAEIGARNIIKALDLIAAGKAPRIPQVNAEATYAKKLTKEDGRINWAASATDIDHHIRAMTPWPSAWTLLPLGEETRTLKVFDFLPSTLVTGVPGQIMSADKHGIMVAAGQGGILLREVQLDGKKRMSAAELARGYSIPTGVILA